MADSTILFYSADCGPDYDPYHRMLVFLRYYLASGWTNNQPQAAHINARTSDQLPSQSFCQYNSRKILYNEQVKLEYCSKIVDAMNCPLPPIASTVPSTELLCIQTLV